MRVAYGRRRPGGTRSSTACGPPESSARRSSSWRRRLPWRSGSDQISGLGDLVSMADRGTRVGLEARAYAGKALPRELRRTMEETRTLDVVDLSQTGPRIAGDTQYTRLFGPGPHNVYQFDDEETRAIERAGGDAVRTAFTFHGVRMYTDAARFLTFKRTGVFPAATSARGLSSLEAVLLPDARFP